MNNTLKYITESLCRKIIYVLVTTWLLDSWTMVQQRNRRNGIRAKLSPVCPAKCNWINKNCYIIYFTYDK